MAIRPKNTAANRAYTGHFGLHDPVAMKQILEKGHHEKPLKTHWFHDHDRSMYLRLEKQMALILLSPLKSAGRQGHSRHVSGRGRMAATWGRLISAFSNVTAFR